MSVDAILKQAEKLTSEDRAELLERLGRNGKTAGVDSANGSVGVAERSYGLLGWTGDPETLRQIAEDDDELEV